MIKVLHLSLFIVVCSVFINNAYSQTAAVDTIGDLKSEKKASLKFGLNYLSNSVLLGRADTVATPSVVPEIKYTFKSGIYLSGNIEYIPNRVTHQLDAGSIAAGYNYDITDDISGSISFSKLFYSASSTQIGSAITSTFNANMDYDISDIITPSISIDYNMLQQGFNSDVLINLGLAHDFAKESLFGDNDLLIISPTATMNAGTQNFYAAYLTRKQYKPTKKGQAKEAVAKKIQAAQEAKLSQFGLLDYEFSAPVEYKTGSFIFSFTPTYAIAENKLPARITSGMVNANGGLFYFQLGAVIKL
jgi:hypothetical protein